ncbi:hypothetical protein [Polaromonas sp. YR568]|uniref:hypothetical protein n=1 Tax=Polaromonas sp. YR568 TaxID=1855301 RepID=UPI00398C08C5
MNSVTHPDHDVFLQAGGRLLRGTGKFSGVHFFQVRVGNSQAADGFFSATLAELFTLARRIVK